MKEHPTPSQRMSAAWNEMAKDNFRLVNLYLEHKKELIGALKKGEFPRLSKEEQPLADYLLALRDYIPSHYGGKL